MGIRLRIDWCTTRHPSCFRSPSTHSHRQIESEFRHTKSNDMKFALRLREDGEKSWFSADPDGNRLAQKPLWMIARNSLNQCPASLVK